MIHSVPQSAKFKLFVRRLRPLLSGLPVGVETVAVGLLERLWHVTCTSAPKGDIGRLDDDLIAEMVGWCGDASELVALLVQCRWLDEHPTYRLVVHDWHDHAPNFVKGVAAKTGGFVTIETPTQGPPPREADSTGVRPPPRDPHPGTPTQGGQQPNLTKPNLTKPDLTQPDTTASEPPRSVGRSDPLIDTATSKNEFVTAWNAAGMKPLQRSEFGPSLQGRLSSLLADPWWRDNWRAAVERAGKSPFLASGAGRQAGPLDVFDFLKDSDFVRQVLHGRFDPTPATPRPPPPGRRGETWEEKVERLAGLHGGES